MGFYRETFNEKIASWFGAFLYASKLMTCWLLRWQWLKRLSRQAFRTNDMDVVLAARMLKN